MVVPGGVESLKETKRKLHFSASRSSEPPKNHFRQLGIGTYHNITLSHIIWDNSHKNPKRTPSQLSFLLFTEYIIN